MNHTDIRNMVKMVRSASTVYVFGKVPVAISEIYKPKIAELDEAELVIINLESNAEIINAIESITANCTILVCDLSNMSEFFKYADGSKSLQYSRPKMVNGCYGGSITLVHTTRITSDRTDPITIFLVLRTGGDVYTYRYVNACINNIKRHISYNHEIVCLTDNPNGIVGADRILHMRHNWTKWWGKVELFRPDATKNKHCLFLDLDTVCMKSINDICTLPSGFYGLRDFYAFDVFQTGILKWEVTEKTANIYNSFITEDFSKYSNRGDHEWIGSYQYKKTYLQDCFPGEIASYKKHMNLLNSGMLTPTILCFHGNPRPHTLTHNFITEQWKY